jgi:epoxyqueuosine reductase
VSRPENRQCPPGGPSTAEVKREAGRLGFVACGVTSLDAVPHGDVLDRWLASGRAGNMRYLHRQSTKRKHPQLVDPDAARAVVVLDSYYYPDSQRTPPPRRPRVARFARGEDYHRVTLRRLQNLAGYLGQNGARVARPYVDTGPIPERELAQRAGLGWIGKNTMLIRPDAGSFCFIGTILTDLPLELDLPFEGDRCGTCTRCLEACPTQAIPEPWVLDATRCISYLTIEHRGSTPDELVPSFAGWAVGCDVCNDVCPWNVRFAEPSTIPEFRPRDALVGAGPDYFESLDESEFERRFGDTALERPGLRGMRRNWLAAWASLEA